MSPDSTTPVASAEDGHLRVGYVGFVFLIPFEPGKDLLPPGGLELDGSDRGPPQEVQEPPAQIPLGQQKARLAQHQTGCRERPRLQGLEVPHRRPVKVVTLIHERDKHVRIDQDHRRF